MSYPYQQQGSPFLADSFVEPIPAADAAAQVQQTDPGIQARLANLEKALSEKDQFISRQAEQIGELRGTVGSFLKTQEKNVFAAQPQIQQPQQAQNQAGDGLFDFLGIGKTQAGQQTQATAPAPQQQYLTPEQARQVVMDTIQEQTQAAFNNSLAIQKKSQEIITRFKTEHPQLAQYESQLQNAFNSNLLTRMQTGGITPHTMRPELLEEVYQSTMAAANSLLPQQQFAQGNQAAQGYPQQQLPLPNQQFQQQQQSVAYQGPQMDQNAYASATQNFIGQEQRRAPAVPVGQAGMQALQGGQMVQPAAGQRVVQYNRGFLQNELDAEVAQRNQMRDMRASMGPLTPAQFPIQ